jgi:glutaconate CoA-transferase, subunit B
MNDASPPTPSEMMIVSASRALEGVRTVFVGVGLSNIACNLARLTVAADLELIYESGVYGARPSRLPLSIGDPTLVSGATAVIPIGDLFGFYLQRGIIEAALVGGAQIDRYGNLNTTVIGDYHSPKVRLPGSGGACEIAINCGRLLILMRLSRRSFVERLDFVTSPGHLGGKGERERLGMPGRGPDVVVTDMATFDFETSERQMRLVSLHPGVSVEDIRERVGWELHVAENLVVTPEPTEEELRLIREELDPGGIYRREAAGARGGSK